MTCYCALTVVIVSGRLDAWKVSKLFEEHRLSFSDCSWFPMQKGSRMIMFAQSLKVAPEFHQSIAQDWPIVMKTAVTELGNTSFTLRSQLLDGDDMSSVVFAERKYRLVSVDMETRKSTALLPEFRAMHEQYAQKCGDADKFPAFDTPDLATAEHVTTITNVTRHSDMDFEFHTNQGVYFRFSQDCASVAAAEGKLKQFSNDMCFYPIQQADVLHKGESFPGDELLIHSWEDPVLKMTMNFVIKKQEKEIFYARFKYFTEDLETV